MVRMVFPILKHVKIGCNVIFHVLMLLNDFLLEIYHVCNNLRFSKAFQIDSPFQELFNGIIYFLVAQKFNELCYFTFII